MTSLTNPKPHLILGAGGHARVLIDALQLTGSNILGALEPDASFWGKSILGVPILAGDDEILSFKLDEVVLVNALGSVSSTKARQKLFELWTSRGYTFSSVIHPTAVISKHATLAQGVQVMASAVIQAGVTVAENTVINTAAVIEHDCKLGAHVHIAPKACLAGGVKVGQGSHVGLGASVLQTLSLGDDCLIAAGAVVVNSVQRKGKVKGVPAKDF